MSTFRIAVSKLIDKEAYFILSGSPVKATIIKVNEDLVILKLSSQKDGVSQFTVHIDSLSWVIGS